LSDLRILIIGPALDAAEARSRLDQLRSISLPNATRYAVTSAKITADDVKLFKVEAGFPAQPSHLQTLAAWAELPHHANHRFRDGFDLYCTNRILANDDGYDVAVLLRNATGLEERWPDLLGGLEDQLFVTFDENAGRNDGAAGRNLLFELRNPFSITVLNAAWEIYASGAAYAMTPYSLHAAFTIAADAQRIQTAIAGNSLRPSTALLRRVLGLRS